MKDCLKNSGSASLTSFDQDLLLSKRPLISGNGETKVGVDIFPAIALGVDEAEVVEVWDEEEKERRDVLYTLPVEGIERGRRLSRACDLMVEFEDNVPDRLAKKRTELEVIFGREMGRSPIRLGIG